MATAGSDQLPAGIQMPEDDTHSLSSQIWFFSGVQAGLEGRSSQNERELAQSIGASVEKAYQAGLAAGQAKRAELESPAHQIPVPEQHSHTLQEDLVHEGGRRWLSGTSFRATCQPGTKKRRRTLAGVSDRLSCGQACCRLIVGLSEKWLTCAGAIEQRIVSSISFVRSAGPTFPVIIAGAAVAFLGIWLFELFPGSIYKD